jgi:hypothetical protein
VADKGDLKPEQGLNYNGGLVFPNSQNHTYISHEAAEGHMEISAHDLVAFKSESSHRQASISIITGSIINIILLCLKLKGLGPESPT